MKKSLSTLFMTLTAVLALNASNVVLFHGTTTVTSSGNSSASDEGGVTLKINDNGLDTLAFHVIPFGVGSIGFNGVHAATSGDVTVYSAERDIQVGFTTEHATLFARTKGEYMTAVIYLSNQDVVIEFDNVGDHFQLPNSDMEAWTNSNGEPDRWHGFKTAGGSFAGTSAGLVKLEQSDDVRSGATGHSAVMTANSIFNVVANGTMTNGKLMAGSMFATDTKNHAEMDKANGTDAYAGTPIDGKVVTDTSVGNVCKHAESGDVDIAFVYTSDVERFGGVKVVGVVPADTHKNITYPGAVCTQSTKAEAAKAFLDWCMTDQGAAEIWQKWGFELAA